jgi:hypothetical protein
MGETIMRIVSFIDLNSFTIGQVTCKVILSNSYFVLGYKARAILQTYTDGNTTCVSFALSPPHLYVLVMLQYSLPSELFKGQTYETFYISFIIE